MCNCGFREQFEPELEYPVRKFRIFASNPSRCSEQVIFERDGKTLECFARLKDFFGGGGEFGGQSISLRESVAFKLFELFLWE